MEGNGGKRGGRREEGKVGERETARETDRQTDFQELANVVIGHEKSTVRVDGQLKIQEELMFQVSLRLLAEFFPAWGRAVFDLVTFQLTG